jgi:hypothetical protein
MTPVGRWADFRHYRIDDVDHGMEVGAPGGRRDFSEILSELIRPQTGEDE